MKYFKEIASKWQTVLFFTMAVAMVLFTVSSLRSAQYIVESKIMVISDNQDVIGCNQSSKSGFILASILSSEAFYEDVTKVTGRVMGMDMLKVKSENSSSIVNLKIEGVSLTGVQSRMSDVQRTLENVIDEYYSPQSKVSIKVLTGPMLTRTPRDIFENTAIGLVIGLGLGIVLSLTTNLQLVLIGKRKSREYNAIIKKKLEQELTAIPEQELTVIEEDYVFGATQKEAIGAAEKIQKDRVSSAIGRGIATSKEMINQKNIRSKAKKILNTNKKSTTRVSKKEKDNVRVIASSMMTINNGKKTEAPANLPVFVEDFREDKAINKSIKKINKSAVINKKKSVERTTQIKSLKLAESIRQLREKQLSSLVKSKKVNNKKTTSTKAGDNSVKKSRASKPKIARVTETVKKPNAHNIANGFTPSKSDAEGPSNEEIKDRLNKLLRGDL